MSWEDYIFEGPWESCDRSQEGYGSRNSFYLKDMEERECTICGHGFESRFPKACPQCGGWTECLS